MLSPSTASEELTDSVTALLDYGSSIARPPPADFPLPPHDIFSLAPILHCSLPSLGNSTPRWHTFSRLLASHQGKQGSVPVWVTPECSYVVIVPDDDAGWRVFPRLSWFPRPCISVLLHSHLIYPTSALKTSLLRDAKTSYLKSILTVVIAGFEFRYGVQSPISENLEYFYSLANALRVQGSISDTNFNPRSVKIMEIFIPWHMHFQYGVRFPSTTSLHRHHRLGIIAGAINPVTRHTQQNHIRRNTVSESCTQLLNAFSCQIQRYIHVAENESFTIQLRIFARFSEEEKVALALSVDNLAPGSLCCSQPHNPPCYMSWTSLLYFHALPSPGIVLLTNPLNIRQSSHPIDSPYYDVLISLIFQQVGKGEGLR
ncbi:hypothetical protein PR048_009124 [Dryococelus australis]|uniref:Uncharacterized protein n=1 Tax=Dryococelus australis TaxID=614101 RepID=A0ABQ9HZ30_9NEOP|nr:hypothetical protein PR048_009124 [Dryococelus australis]